MVEPGFEEDLYLGRESTYLQLAAYQDGETEDVQSFQNEIGWALEGNKTCRGMLIER